MGVFLFSWSFAPVIPCSCLYQSFLAPLSLLEYTEKKSLGYGVQYL